MDFAIFDRLKDIMKKHSPEILHRDWLAIRLIDAEIQSEVALMRYKGKSDDEIQKVIEPMFEERLRPLLDRE